MRRFPLLLAILWFGCTGSGPAFKTDDDPASFVGPLDTGAPGDSGTTTDTADSGTWRTTDCAEEVGSLFPEDGDRDAYFRTPVRALLAREDPEAVIHVTDAGGVEVPGVTSVVWGWVSWSGEPLAPDAAYTATLGWTCGSLAWDFETNAVGAPIAGDPVGVVYEVDLSKGEWVSPPGVGTLLASQIDDATMLVGPTALDTASVTLLVAVADAGVQDLCVPTVDVSGDWDDPVFSSITPTVPFGFGGAVMNVEDATLSGAFAPDLSLIDGLALAGILDTRQIADAFPEIGTTDDAVCDLVSTFGVICGPCADGLDLCLDLYIDGLDGASALTTVVPRTDADIAADPTCQ